MLLYLKRAGNEFYIGHCVIKVMVTTGLSFCTHTAYRLLRPMSQVWKILGQCDKHVAHLSDFYFRRSFFSIKGINNSTEEHVGQKEMISYFHIRVSLDLQHVY